MFQDIYEYFYQTAIKGSISKAAQELYISQPALSKAINTLETSLKCRLFNRTNRGVTLTLEGEILFNSVCSIHDILNETKQQITGRDAPETSELHIGTGRDLFRTYLMPRLKLFHENHRNIKLHIHCMYSDTIEDSLMGGDIDIAITTRLPKEHSMHVWSIMELHDCFIVGKKYEHMVNEGPWKISGIVTYPLLMLPQYSQSRKAFDSYFEHYGIIPKPLFEISDTSLLAQATVEGYGIGCVVGEYVTEELERGDLWKLPIYSDFAPRHAYLIWTGKTSLSTPTKELLLHLRIPASRK